MKWFGHALAAGLLIAAAPVFAQGGPPVTVRATIASIAPDGESLTLRTREGKQETVRLNGKTGVTLVVPASLSKVKPGAFIGVAALPGAGDELKAIEVHIFPESMRGAGEGFRPFDLAPGSTMTNGSVKARVDSVEGSKLTVTYHGGQQTIVVDPKAPVVGFAAGSRGDLKPGAAVIARGTRGSDGAIDAARILVGKDGLTPPM